LKWLGLTQELESIISHWKEPRVFLEQQLPLPQLTNEQLLAIGIGGAAAVAAGVIAALVLIPPPTSTTTPPTPTPSPSPSPFPSPSPQSATNVSFSVSASDSEDPYLRDWTLLVDGQSIAQTTEVSGGTMIANATLQPGNHTLEIEISQNGGTSYGTYSGTATINGRSYPFSGVDVNNPASISFTV
jgi:hypothetical protein